MQRLNIPLSKHTKTTRRNRRVVWQFAWILFIASLCGWRAIDLWLSRPSIFSLAPADTAIAIQLQLTPTTTPDLLDWFGNVPLISGRSITLEDVMPYTHGDIALFVDTKGRRSIALAHGSSTFPEDLAQSFHVSTQSEGRFTLVSSTLAPISGIESSPRRRWLPSLRRRWIGRIALPLDERSGHLFHSIHGPILQLSSDASLSYPAAPESSTISIPHLSVASGASFFSIDQLLASFSPDSQYSSLFFSPSTRVRVVVTPDSPEPGLFLDVEHPSLTSEALIHELQLMAAFARPRLIPSELPDGTTMNILRVDPSLVSVEEVSTPVGLGYRIPMAGGESVIAVVHDTGFYLASSESLLHSLLETDGQEWPHTCPETSTRIDTPFLLSQMSLSAWDPSYALLTQLFSSFSHISLEFKKYSMEIRACSD